MMELRSSRSRSKTPFSSNVSFEEEVTESENHVEKIVRTTRSTTKIVERITDDVMVNSTKPSKYKTTKAEKSSRRKLKTSDYSSEEGENVVSSSHTISQNEKNHLIEEVRAAANGTGKISALDLYRKAGRYWDVYPKTDWTYSPHSKDRVEIAPGVVAMPNMSRRSLHKNITATDEFSSLNKYTNTESFDTVDTHMDYNSISSYHPRTLSNNNYKRTYENQYVYSSTSYKRTRISRFFIGVYTTIITFLYYLYKKQNTGVLWLLKKIHNVSSHFMLIDTWLLKPRHMRGNKLPLIFALCLIPLFLLGGWWLLGTLGHVIYGMYANTISAGLLPLPTGLLKAEQQQYFKAPTADEIAASLSQEQLDKIASFVKIEKDFDYELVIRKILDNPEVRASLKNNNNDDSIINTVKKEVEKIRYEFLGKEREHDSEINRIVQQLRFENMQNTARLTHELRRCCRHSFVNIESHVLRVLKDLLGRASDENDIMRQLHFLFVAKQDLEMRLSNLTQDLNRHFDGLIEESGRKVMEEITAKIDQRFKSVISSERHEHVSDFSDGYIEEIVQNALAVYDADKTGLVDYAMEPLGGQVLSTRCTESYSSGTAVISILGIPLWHPTNSPRTVITPGIKPGECWAFQNFPGFLLIKLVSPIKIEAFTLEHVSKNLVPGGKIDSAPKEFEVYGLKNETDREPTKLGSYKYDYNGKPLQTFAAHVHGLVFDIIELRILSNHGNPNFTCLYRFRVHGKLSRDEPT